MVEHLELEFGKRTDSAINTAEISQMQAILSRTRAVRNSLYLNHHQAQLLYLEGRVHATVAEQLSKQKRLQQQRASTAPGSTTPTTQPAPSVSVALDMPSDIPVGSITFILDYNPGNGLPLVDTAVTVHYDHIRLAWVVDTKTWAAGEEAASLATALQGANFETGIEALLKTARETNGEVRTDKATYRVSTSGRDFLISEGKERQNFAYLDGHWQRYEGGKWLSTGTPPSNAFADLWKNLRELDEQSGAVLLFAYNKPEVYEAVKTAPRILNKEPLPAETLQTTTYYTVKQGKTPSGEDTLILHAGQQPLGIYILPGRYVFVQQADNGQMRRVGATDDQLNFVINEENVRASGAPIAVQQHVLALQGKRYRHLIQGSILVNAQIPNTEHAGFKGTITEQDTPQNPQTPSEIQTSPPSTPPPNQNEPTAGQLQQNPGEQ
jgi:hypothetical protein